MNYIVTNRAENSRNSLHSRNCPYYHCLRCLFTSAVMAANGGIELREHIVTIWNTVSDGEKELWRSNARKNTTADEMKQFITVKDNNIVVAPVVFDE